LFSLPVVAAFTPELEKESKRESDLFMIERNVMKSP